ncbi:class F sortase [Nocardioides piscis]|uniref:Class F sortase n=1 Tax=Nocardioides piscis TaxID=2714938 RepID=A0A6G7YL42_9ACTN|nr:class F sortase [Nocardioides piscis]
MPEPRRHQAAAPPRRVEVDALGIDVEVIPIELEASTLVPPDDPQVLGWWAEGAVPGARRGSALVTGHTVHAGGGALDHLETLRQGQSVTVTTEAGSIAYRVSRVEVFVKSRIAASAERLFSQRVRGRLVLVTCEDWNGVSYESNVVVIAHPV